MKLRTYAAMLLAVVEIKAALIDRAVAMSSGFSLCMMGNHDNHGNHVIMVKIDTRWHARSFFTQYICTTIIYRYFLTEYIQHDTSLKNDFNLYVHTQLSFLSPQAKL